MGLLETVTEIPFVDESSERELLLLLGNWYEPETFESVFSSCCLLFFLGNYLALLGVPPCQFCSSTAEHLVVCSLLQDLIPLSNHHMLSFYIQRPISVHFPYIEVSSS